LTARRSSSLCSGVRGGVARAGDDGGSGVDIGVEQ
jgi:hypothetical protein